MEIVKKLFISHLIILFAGLSCQSSVNRGNFTLGLNESRCDSFLLSLNAKFERTSSVCNLVFEGDFSDTLEVFTDGLLHVHEVVKSNKSVGIVPKMYKIEKNILGIKLRINLLREKRCLEFMLEPGFKYCYLTKNDEKRIWYIEYSNERRSYK